MRRSKTNRLWAGVMMVCMASSAMAQGNDDTDGRKVKIIDFERGSTVHGGAEDPWLESTVIRLGGQFGSLVEVRTDFKDRMVKDAEAL